MECFVRGKVTCCEESDWEEVMGRKVGIAKRLCKVFKSKGIGHGNPISIRDFWTYIKGKM
jgi:hypothetical protein